MMQIGVSNLPADLRDGLSPDPDAAGSDRPRRDSRPVSGLPEDAGDGILFMSPPPLPFPRVFPGL